MNPRRKILAAAVFAGYAGTVYGANWLVGHVGQLPVGFGLAAPAGVYAAGPMEQARRDGAQ